MAKEKGLRGWVEIFRAGRHIDSKGRPFECTAADIKRFADQYDSAKHEAPVVIGHPKDTTAPAYGWVEKLKAAGDVMLAKFRQVEPAFEKIVESGRFKKRSVAILPDGTLMHVGFLGAAAPAVKGLQDIEFQQDEGSTVIEFTAQEENNMPTVEELQKQLADEQAARQKAEADRDAAKALADTASAQFSEAQTKQRQTEINGFIEQGVKEGKILPAWKDQGLAEFMEHLGDEEATLTFSEGVKKAPGQWFRDFILSFSSHPLFKDMARPDKETDGKDHEFEQDMKTAREIVSFVQPQK